ncbi:hypothetical protein AMTRI_Chr07g80580 [Amborella trichopoda]
MQPSQQHQGGRNLAPCRSSSSSPSPSSSSSAVSATHLGLDALQFQQQQQPQQIVLRQSLQQQLRKPEDEATLLAYQAGGLHGALGGSSFSSSSAPMDFSQQQRKFVDASQHQGASQARDDSQFKGQLLEQNLPNQIYPAYLQYVAFQAAQQKAHGNMQSQQNKSGAVGLSGKEQEMRANNLKMQELMSIQAANQTHASTFKKPVEHFAHSDNKQMEHGQPSSDQRNDFKPPQPVIGQLGNIVRPVQGPTSQPNVQNMANNQLVMMQAMQAWALEHNIDLSAPGNAHLITQLLPLWQSKLAPSQKPKESNSAQHPSRLASSKQQVGSSSHDYSNVGSENSNSAHGNSLTEASGLVGSSSKTRHSLPLGPFPSGGVNANNIQMQQASGQGQQNQVERNTRHPSGVGSGLQGMHPPQSSANMGQNTEQALPKASFAAPEPVQMQYYRQSQQLNRNSSQPSVSNEGLNAQFHPQVAPLAPQQRFGFTKDQLHVLKAQILAFRRLKRGEGHLPQEVLQSIAPPPLNPQQVVRISPLGAQERSTGRSVEEHPKHVETNDKAPHIMTSTKGQGLMKEESSVMEEKMPMRTALPGITSATAKDSMENGSVTKEEQSSAARVKSEHEFEHGSQRVSVKGELPTDRGRLIQSQSVPSDASQVKKLASAGTTPIPKDANAPRKYYGPLFDFPFFSKKHEAIPSPILGNNMGPLSMGYDVKDILLEEGVDVLKKKRTENMKKIECLLAVNLERKRIRPDLVLKLQIEERKLRLLDLQARVRDEVDQQQQEIMAMGDRPYRKFMRQCERQRLELARQVQISQKVIREKQLKSVFQWRKKLLEAHWAIRDARTARNRGVAKYHERMLKEFSKRKDWDRNKRMEALKNNDVDRYREMLLEQQTNIPGDAAQRYAVLSSFLSQTEDYLHKLGGKITAVKNNQEVEEAALAAAAAARSHGLSEEEVKAAAACAGEEVMIRNRFSEMNAPRDSSSVNKYYNLAHAVNERVIRQPSMLRAGTLRDYQLVGLQWMLSLYNNKLNGILADEMGLGKTVQVMALMAYLMEFKGNYGPHLIIVPNAVLVNWKSELHSWLPSVSCIYYVGGKEQRMKLYTQEVCAMKFNALITTYEFIMRDRSKLSKIDWKYVIIDEAQRMKDRESRLARDLDRFRCQRRLLLTGTPLQNDLQELWSLLNLLLPEVFDNCKAFHDWFAKPFQKDNPSSQNAEDDWLETEKKVIIIHRLHQILEPFMLRRRVEDVEGSLPPKVSIVLRCKMSAVQGAIYDWVKATGSIRLEPQAELKRVAGNPNRQVRAYVPLQNRCMELRKVCNHPLLNYPYLAGYSKEYIVRSCGKLWILDRILIKLHRTGHRVLLFSTMTKLLDILEEYLQWRGLVYRRIDGTTSLEDRESAIVEFNSPGSRCFIFLLSIRAAGRGLNLQSADTVVIYDPDPNPKNEEQAVARAHRIGQKRAVKVIYMEAVADTISSYQKEDELRNGGTVDLEDELAGKDRYMGSIESLVRNNIQQYKIDMADEVINAGRFDQRTTQEERRMTLETLLHDEERYQETVHDVPSLQEVNRMIARSEEEVELFDQMDEELDWTEEMIRYDEIPKWLRAGSREVNAAVSALSKKASKSGLIGHIGLYSEEEKLAAASPSKIEKKRGRPKGSSTIKKLSTSQDLDTGMSNGEIGEDVEASSDERASFMQEEEGEIGDYEDEGFDRSGSAIPYNKDPSEEEGQNESSRGGYGFSKSMDVTRNEEGMEEGVSSGSSSENRRVNGVATSTLTSQKFGSLSALDARPGSVSKRMQSEELEEGEIVASGDSHMDLQQSGSWIHERDDGEDEQVLQPKIKRKRSIRIRRSTSEKTEDRYSNEKVSHQHGNSNQFANKVSVDYGMQQRQTLELETYTEPVSGRQDPSDPSSRQRRNLPPRRGTDSPKLHGTPKQSRVNELLEHVGDGIEYSRESSDSKSLRMTGPVFGSGQTSDNLRKKCKHVLSKLQRAIDKDGHQLVPILTDFWKRSENAGGVRGINMGNNPLDLRAIDQRVDRGDYSSGTDLAADIQLMLKNATHYCGYSAEVRSDARKLQSLAFECLKVVFPETDLREAKTLGSFTGPTSTLSPRNPSQNNRPFKPVDDSDQDHVDLVPTTRHHRGSHPSEDGPKDPRSHPSRPNEPRGPRDDVASLTHPGDLVICKKKRKDRDKGAVKVRGVQDTCQPLMGQAVRENTMSQNQRQPHGWLQLGNKAGGGTSSGGVNELQWAKPVKRLRTDTGKRRPSHI